jgi:hypothetical protein
MRNLGRLEMTFGAVNPKELMKAHKLTEDEVIAIHRLVSLELKVREQSDARDESTEVLQGIKNKMGVRMRAEWKY